MPIGTPELIIVLVIALIIFGPKKLPQLGRSLGSGMREFKNSVTGGKDDDDAAEIAAPAAKPAGEPASAAAKPAGEPASAAAKPAGEPAAIAPRDDQ